MRVHVRGFAWRGLRAGERKRDVAVRRGQVAARGPTHHNLHTGTHAEGCGPDIRKYCAGIRAGHGLIHQCLLDNRHRLSAECRVPRGQVVRRGSAADAEAEAARARAREAAASNASLGSSGPRPPTLAPWCGLCRARVVSVVKVLPVRVVKVLPV